MQTQSVVTNSSCLVKPLYQQYVVELEIQAAEIYGQEVEAGQTAGPGDQVKDFSIWIHI